MSKNNETSSPALKRSWFQELKAEFGKYYCYQIQLPQKTPMSFPKYKLGNDDKLIEIIHYYSPPFYIFHVATILHAIIISPSLVIIFPLSIYSLFIHSTSKYGEWTS